MATTVKLDETARDELRLLADAEGLSMTEKLERMIRAEKRRHFMASVNAAYGALRADEAAWADEEAERAVLAGSLADGLDDEAAA